MTASSPWSQDVARSLAAAGQAVHIVDFSHSSDAYLSANAALSRTLLDELGFAASRHLIRSPAPLAARVPFGAYHTRRIADQTRADVVLTLYAGTNAAIAYCAGIRPYVVYVVGSDVLLTGGIRRTISRRSLTGASVVLANGEYLAERTRELAPRAHVLRHYLGVDLDRFRPASPGHPRRFVCARGFHAVYDNATIVRAVGLCTDLPEDFELVFLSTGPLLDEVKGLAGTLPPARRGQVSFRGGVSPAGMLEALQGAGFYLSASLSDGSSASLLEAMATGLYPIVTDIPANREWVTPGVNGALFPAGDAAGLAAAIERACRQPDLIPAAAAMNRRIVAERADKRGTMTALAALLETTASGPATRASA